MKPIRLFLFGCLLFGAVCIMSCIDACDKPAPAPVEEAPVSVTVTDSNANSGTPDTIQE